ncbi:MAG TPA: hypothetical protein VJ373_03600 [Desulfatiglandales bacterium]|nr:hypothetical protein [Desulfatiglandales bacterium]
MNKDIKNDLKRLAKETEVKLAESILRWKYKKEGKKPPDKDYIEHKSRTITDRANMILVQRGKNIFNEFKKAYHESRKKAESDD